MPNLEYLAGKYVLVMPPTILFIYAIAVVLFISSFTWMESLFLQKDLIAKPPAIYVV